MRNLACSVATSCVLLLSTSAVTAQETVSQPAEAARERSEGAPGAEVTVAPGPAVAPEPAAVPAPAAEPAAHAAAAAAPELAVEPEPVPAAADDRVPSYEARAVVQAPLREEERIGAYEQPRWTARRRFPTTRVYVRPANTFALEWWLELKQSLRDENDARWRSQYELEMGLGHRLQLDVYLQTEQDGHRAPLELRAEKLELRWAIADWGVVPLNPTLYVELIRQHDAPPKVELKGLFGEELASRWHWGFNLVWERELGDVQESEYAAVTGVSYTIVDGECSLGAEVKFETVDVEGARLAFDNWALLAGPSLAWSPVPPMHLLLVALFGQETEGPVKTGIAQPTLVVGWEI